MGPAQQQPGTVRVGPRPESVHGDATGHRHHRLLGVPLLPEESTALQRAGFGCGQPRGSQTAMGARPSGAAHEVEWGLVHVLPHPLHSHQ